MAVIRPERAARQDDFESRAEPSTSVGDEFPRAVTPRSSTFLGIRVQPLSADDLLRVIERAVASGRPCVIANHNLHSLYLCHHNQRMRDFHCVADYTHVDGVSIVALGRLFGAPLRREHRTGYVDLLPRLASKAAERRWRIFYLGSRPFIAERGAQLLRGRFPGLQIETRDGYFDLTPGGDGNRSVLETIAACDPDVLLVGMGMPRQETWILDNLERISARAILCSGSLMDYVVGETPTPPRWLGPIGLEWLYRLASEPKRLWRRYLVEPWFVAWLAARHLWKRAKQA